MECYGRCGPAPFVSAEQMTLQGTFAMIVWVDADATAPAALLFINGLISASYGRIVLPAQSMKSARANRMAVQHSTQRCMHARKCSVSYPSRTADVGPVLAQEGFRAIEPGLRGYGASDKPTGVKEYKSKVHYSPAFEGV